MCLCRIQLSLTKIYCDLGVRLKAIPFVGLNSIDWETREMWLKFICHIFRLHAQSRKIGIINQSDYFTCLLIVWPWRCKWKHWSVNLLMWTAFAETPIADQLIRELFKCELWTVVIFLYFITYILFSVLIRNQNE